MVTFLRKLVAFFFQKICLFQKKAVILQPNFIAYMRTCNQNIILYMKRFFFFALLCILARGVWANDYMEHPENYQVYASGIDKIHFSIPVWVHGDWYERSYSALPGSHFTYKVGTGDEVTVLNWLAHDVRDNDRDNDKGTLAVKFQPNQGQLYLTCMHDGIRRSVLDDGNWSDWLTVKQKPAGGYDRVTILEFDWYPPQALDGKDFTIKMYSEFDDFEEILDEIAYSFCDPFDDYSNIDCYYEVNPDYSLSWQVDNTFKGKEQLVTPTLFDPYLYQMSEDGLAGYGYAAIPYSLGDPPISYRLSVDSSLHSVTEQAGNIFVMTSDTLIKDVCAKFIVWRDSANNTKDSIMSTKVDVKPYHRIHDFVAKEETDSTDTYTGVNVLSWTVKNPLLEDIVEGDYFEIVRATDTAFTDASSLTVIPLEIDSLGQYSYRDEDRSISTGHLDGDSLTLPLVYSPDEYYELKDQNGQTMYLVKLQIQTEKTVVPSLPVYYRIRRASAAVWGWHPDFTEQRTVYKHNFLAPLDSEQPEYEKDADYENNHKVNFRIVLKNEEVPTVLPAEDTFEFSYTPVHSAWDSLPAGIDSASVNPDLFMTDTLKAQLKDTLYSHLKAEYEANPFGKCMWDKTANLILIKTIEETGTSTESIVPQDSIRRLDNGDWEARFSDIADKGCTHYSYAVRIDQSHADLHVRVPQTQLAPMTITGPELYFDESAKIVEFTATQGDARSDLKQGVLLNWKPSSSAVDEYILCRIMQGGSGAPDTLYTGIETTFMDITALPDIHYEYTISSYYYCNGKSSSNSATTEGWRTNLGEINGAILLPDNSGMAGVTVALQDSTGTVIRTQVTGADGAYLFDSLEYYQVDCHFTPIVKLSYSHYAQVQDPKPYVRIRITDADGTVQKDWGTMDGGTYEYVVGTKFEIKTTEEGNENKDKVTTVTIKGDCEILCENQAHTEGEMHIVPRFVVNVKGNEDFVPCKTIQSSANYVVIPTHEYGVFSFNYTDAGSAAITLSKDNSVADHIDFINTNSTRLTGRALYENTTIPVAGAMFRLNGDTVRRGGAPLMTGTDGNFELSLTMNEPYTLQIFKPSHTFAQDGYFQMEEGKDTFAIDKPLDGIRFNDQTRVRLVGRVAGGNDQRDLPEAFGLGKNNLGDDLQLVFQLEGDNVAHFVYDPNDLTRDTVQQVVDHLVYTGDTLQPTRSVGTTHSLFEKKRIIVQPDPTTGEYEVDLCPVKYKVTQATAKGYATLFTDGTGNETFDLTNAPLTHITDTLNGDTVHYNATYDRIYHTPIQVELKQNLYGLERAAYGEPEMEVNGINPNKMETVSLYTISDGEATYTLGYPVFRDDRKYQFKAKAYEAFYYNNDPAGAEDIVPQRGGSVIIRNGMHSATEVERFPLNEKGENNVIWLTVDDVDVEHAGTAPLRSVSIALEDEGNIVETNVFSGFIAGSLLEANSLRTSRGDIQLLDIVRDPGGAGSSSYVENGAEYTFSYAQTVKAEYGIKLSPTWGTNLDQYIGAYTGSPVGGSFIGEEVNTQKAISFDLPISHKIDYGHSYTYKMTTNNRIETSSDSSPTGVGSPADVFFGTEVANIIGKMKTISIIDDSLYQMCQPSFNAGTMLLLAQGTDSVGKAYYLVTGQKIYVSSLLTNTFTYSQYYIWNTLIPRLAMDRQDLLKNFSDSVAAQAYADATGRPTYWTFETGSYINDTIPVEDYRMFTPNDGGAYTDEVAELNNAITRWLEILYANEREKVIARQSGINLGTYSVSFGNSFSHSESYAYEYSYNEYPQSFFGERDLKKAGITAIGSLLASAIKYGWASYKGKIGTSAINAALQSYSKIFEEKKDGENKTNTVAAQAGNMKFHMGFGVIANTDKDKRMTTTAAISKTAGFTLVADPKGDITTSVYRAEVDSAWLANSSAVLEQVEQDGNYDMLYGSYVFFTEAGATLCPHEEEEKTLLYNQGTTINNSTTWVSKPELTADRYEIANVSSDKRASFRITLFNQGQMDAGAAENGQGFYLCLNGVSNPNGAKVYVNGAPLINSIYYWIQPSTPITQTIEVERGTVDDYDLSFSLYSEHCASTSADMNIGVHFLPVSTEVAVAAPHQNWVMNTLSQRDSTGYYLPITIDGFDIHHKNFDHIEFQYKLSAQSDDNWVNLCSFYASDSLYDLATGNKAMIENGRITPFRFYGERDPMEQRYDLRAVSFCRYGSGFVSKASPVISGTKDTRPPVVFGEPEPANSILGVGDNLKLRFNEAIAGNYLDEDNNFQITGITNETGLAASTALHFDGNSVAYTKVKRDISEKSFTIDMMIRPAVPNNRAKDMILFEATKDQITRQFILTGDNRLRLLTTSSSSTVGKTSKPIGDLLALTRVLVVYDKNTAEMRFYAGSEDFTDSIIGGISVPDLLSSSTYFKFGETYDGDMLEARIWTKALTLEEIVATANHSLTGYERELLAYYRMNEGKGDAIEDYAHGATLYLDGCAWNKQKGFSLHLDGTNTAQLDGNLIGRSAVYDESILFWFNAESDGTLFSAGSTIIAIENGNIVFRSGNLSYLINHPVVDNEWHHLVLTISRTYNNAALFLDGRLYQSFDALPLEGITGAMYLGGNGFKGNIDEFVIFEQALPKSLVDVYEDVALTGDEMGLMAYLPFEEQYLNPSGVLQLRFSGNDKRIYKNPETGEVIDKIVPLVISDVTGMEDEDNNAPVKSHGLLTKLNFNWSFNNNELMINILNRDYEVNKQSIYVSVRDVEDLNGNPMPSPVTWTAFVDRNSLKWSSKQLNIQVDDETDNNPKAEIRIVNQSGKHHTYSIESLPSWLTVKTEYGSIDPMEEITVTFTCDHQIPVGEYSDLIYLTDEDGLSEPLKVDFIIEAICPWDPVDGGQYDQSMSLCGQVVLADENEIVVQDTSNDDIIAAFCNGELVGTANNTFDNTSNKSYVYLTIYGTAENENKPLSFKLWQASTGRIYNLTTERVVQYHENGIEGYAPAQPIILSAYAGLSQQIALKQGWNWISLNLKPVGNGVLNTALPAAQGWNNEDLIKSSVARTFAQFVKNDTINQWTGTLNRINYQNMYMVYVQEANPALMVDGTRLTDEDRVLTVNKGWNSIACLLDDVTLVNEALADYYDNATEGDLIKSKNAVAVFSQDSRWVGSLTHLRPGEGYLFRRYGEGAVSLILQEGGQSNNAPKRTPAVEHPEFTNPNAATNSTMIARVESQESRVESLKVFVNDELAAVAEPIDSLYFITIQSDQIGELRFEMNGETYVPVSGIISYSADSHHGSLRAPIVLKPAESDRPYKIIENQHVVIIRNNEKYDVTGKKL